MRNPIQKIIYSMLFFSTNAIRRTCSSTAKVDLKQALLLGQAPDRGLYMPEVFPIIPPQEITSFAQMTYPGIAFQVLRRYTSGILDDDTLLALCHDAYNFDVPLVAVQDCAGRYILRLDRGPTASFKDFAARMMARLMGRFVRESGGELTILTATSGDTGAAVASAFHQVPGIRVLVLFPHKEVSERQRKQMTTLGENISTISINGKFDDCQSLVKQAFADPFLRDKLQLSSANSINIGRLLPQSVYYFYAASRMTNGSGEPVIFSVPSGNFGDMMGGMIAKKMGLEVAKILAPVNGNDAFPNYLSTGDYHKIEPSRNCISNAMNVGHPSNLARLVCLYGGQMDEKGIIHQVPDLEALRKDVYSVSVSDAQSKETIVEAWKKHHLLLEPHGAVGWKGYCIWLALHPEAAAIPTAVLETAHPAKFPAQISQLLGFEPETPKSLSSLDSLTEHYDKMEPQFVAFKDYLLKHFSR